MPDSPSTARVPRRDVHRDVRQLAPALAARVHPPTLPPSHAERSIDHDGAHRRWVDVPPIESGSGEPPWVRECDRRYRRMLVIADVLAVTLALALCIPLLGDGDMLTPLVVVGIPLVVVLTKVLGLYDRDELLLRKTTLDEVPRLFQVATLATVVLSLGASSLVNGDLGRKQTLGFWLTISVLLLLLRAATRALARRLVPAERCLLVGDSIACNRIISKIETSARVNAQVVARVPFDTATDKDDVAAVIGLLAEERRVHRVVIAPTATDGDDVLDLIRVAKNLGLKVSVLPRVFEVVGSSVEFDDVEGIHVLGIRRFGLTRSSWLVKRSVDIVVSSVMLVLLSPALAAIAVAITLDSPGPVLFRQQRVGRGGRLFWILKFRTMVQDAERRKAQLHELNEADGLFKIAHDPRITRVGSVLRRTGLDELPQLVNVLCGEMSLVGPRPLVLEDDERVEGWYRRRLHLTPGITGRWQILGSARIPLHEMVKLDYLYVANWSLWGDLKILIRTVEFAVRRRGL